MIRKTLKKFVFTLLIAIILIVITGNCIGVFAASGHAYCAGVVETGVDSTSSVKNAYNNYKAMGYSSRYDLNPDGNTLKGSFSDGNRYLESKVVLLFGHGVDGGTALKVSNNSGIRKGTSGVSFVGIDDINFNKVNLVTLVGCETSFSDKSLAVEIYRRGAANTIGWRQSVYSDSLNQWTIKYNNALRDGKSVGDAVAYAGQSQYSDPRVKDIGFFGAHTNKVNSVDIPEVMSLNKEEIETNTCKVSEDIYFENNNKEIDKLTSYMTSKYPSFKKEEYEIKVYELNRDQGLYTIDYNRKIGDFYTDLGYVITVKEGKVESITDNNKILEDNVYSVINKKVVSVEELQDYKEVAKEQIVQKSKRNKLNNMFNGKNLTITDQETQLYLDVNTNKQYYKVFTTYKDIDGAMDVDYYLVEL